MTATASAATAPHDPSKALRELAERWKAARPAELANAQSFTIELCEALGVPRPGPSGTDYSFEQPVKLALKDGTEAAGRIDVYKRDCFVLESKHAAGSGRDEALRRAYGQARQYAQNDPHGTPPPYLMVLDVGRTLMVWHRWGGTYQGYAAGHRVDLQTLHQRPADILLLRDIWLDPAKRDPRRHAQAVTKEIAGKLARLAASLEARGFEQERVARFLMRVVFSCFAEDVGLLPREAFRQTVQNAGVGGDPAKFARALEALWKAMDEGGMFGYESLLRFNGHFFANAEALPLERRDIELLLEAARADWTDVEPTIFGTLLTRALDPAERHRLGAEYTPREFIERLIRPTVEEPVRERWTAVQAEVLQLTATGKKRDREAAEQRIRDFLAWMRGLRVLDPACGSGNFLYVTMHLLKDIEWEVTQELAELTGTPELRMDEIGPWNFLGLEIKPWAREIAELTLWIGHHQFWRRHHAVQPPEPVLQDTGTLECRDAVLEWNARAHVPAKDRPDPTPRVRHPVTGELVPDPAAKVPYMEHVGARRAPWPQADFIIGNPPYMGDKRMREALGDGYVDALRRAYPEVPASADFVMLWWSRAADEVAAGRTVRAGLITTNSIRDKHNRALIVRAEEQGARVVWSVADHPWADDADSADVWVAMTVLARGTVSSVLVEVDRAGNVARTDRVQRINADLTAHADVPSAAAVPLAANRGLSSRGFTILGEGFVLSPERKAELLAADAKLQEVIRPYQAGRDLSTRPRERYIIDFGLMQETEAMAYPTAYSIVEATVKPERVAKERSAYARFWWRFGEPRKELRAALAGLPRYIVTGYVAKHKLFTFLDADVAPDGGFIVIASDDPFHLGVLSSSIHREWALEAGGRQGVGNDPRYNNSLCFEPFPFPAASDGQRRAISELALRIEAHRKAALMRGPKVTMTGMYNVLDKFRAGKSLTVAERGVFETAGCSILMSLHDELDRGVAEAYGWSWPEPSALILERLVALHDQRVEQEAAGTVRWLRPDYQKPRFDKGTEAAAEAQKLDLPGDEASAPVATAASAALVPWPGDAVGQITVLRTMAAMTPLSIEDAVRRLAGAKKEIVARHLETLAMLGEVRDVGGGRYGVALGAY